MSFCNDGEVQQALRQIPKSERKTFMISFRPLIGAEPSPFTAERTKRVVNPEVPFTQGLPAALASALGAVPGSSCAWALASGTSQCPFLARLGLLMLEHCLALAGFTGLRRLG